MTNDEFEMVVSLSDAVTKSGGSMKSTIDLNMTLAELIKFLAPNGVRFIKV